MTPDQLELNSWARAIIGSVKGGLAGGDQDPRVFPAILCGKACQSWNLNEDAQILLLIVAKLQLEQPQLKTPVSPSTPLANLRHVLRYTLRLAENKKRRAILTDSTRFLIKRLFLEFLGRHQSGVPQQLCDFQTRQQQRIPALQQRRAGPDLHLLTHL